MKILKLLEGRDRLDGFITGYIDRFLIVLNAAGGYAPTVTDTGFGGGRDIIERIDVSGNHVDFPNGGEIILCCQNWFRGEPSGFTIAFPATLIDSCDPVAIKAFVEADKKAKADKKAREENATYKTERAEDLKHLAELKLKYPE